jgi:mRNA interferase YafQ
MRAIRRTKRFKRDYKREKSGRHGKTLDAVLREILELLVADTSLPYSNFDHPFKGDWVDHRDCHIKPD